MKIRFYDMNEAREAAGLAPADYDVEISDEIHVAYDGVRDGHALVAFYSEDPGFSDGRRDGWLVAHNGDETKGLVKGPNGRNAMFSDWVVIP